MEPTQRDGKGVFLSLGMTRQLGRQARGGSLSQPAQGDKAEVRQGTETIPREVWEFGKLKTAQGRSR